MRRRIEPRLEFSARYASSFAQAQRYRVHPPEIKSASRLFLIAGISRPAVRPVVSLPRVFGDQCSRRSTIYLLLHC